MNKIWQKYLAFEWIKVFCLFIGCFYFLYVLIDYSVHTKEFQNNAITLFHLVAYYGCQFTKRADILIPIASLISTVKVLTTSNLRGEIVALATGGLSLKKIMTPLLVTALFCSAFLYFNFQYLQPFCLTQISTFEENFFKAKANGKAGKPVHALTLEDNTLLIYRQYDSQLMAFVDAYWIKNHDSLFRIQQLFPYAKTPHGIYVDSLERSLQGEMIKTASYETMTFPHMHFDSKTLFNAAHPPRMQSMTQLARSLSWKQMSLAKLNDREAETATHFYYKLLAPLVCLLAVIGPAPFCLRFTRTLPVFFIYAFGLFGMIAFYTLMNASIVLGESQIFPPLIAILLPQTTFFLILGIKYAKL